MLSDYRPKRFLLKFLVTSASMLVVVKILPWAEVSDPIALVVAALLLGIFNSLLRPLLIILTLPINIISLGLFTFVINGLILYLIAFLVSGFELKNFASAILASIMISIVSGTINWLIKDTRKERTA
ncbi:MAG: phage holin family protein [candidate division Zixibacteria bacterium]